MLWIDFVVSHQPPLYGVVLLNDEVVISQRMRPIEVPFLAYHASISADLLTTI